MKAAGFIDSHRELWWDVRPNAENGTIEVRICDMPADLPDVLGLTAMIQCLVQSLSDEIDRGHDRAGAAPADDPPEPVAGLPVRPGRRAGRSRHDGGPARPRAAEVLIRRLESLVRIASAAAGSSGTPWR